LSQLPSGVFRVPILWANAPWVAEGEAAAKMKLYAGFDDASLVYADELEGGGEVRATHGWELSMINSKKTISDRSSQHCVLYCRMPCHRTIAVNSFSAAMCSRAAS
jgi:hypothetical protein